MNYYSLKNPSGFYNRPFLATGDLHAQALIRKLIEEDDTGEAQKQLLEAILYRVGHFDTDRGRFKNDRCHVVKVCDIPLNFEKGDVVDHEKV